MLHVMKLIIQISLLFVVYAIGAAIQDFLNLFIPGSVIGLIIMFILLTTGVMKEKWIERGARFMIQHLVLFFIPATVGVLNYYGLFKGKGILLIVITIVSTLLVMITSGLTSQLVAVRKDAENE